MVMSANWSYLDEIEEEKQRWNINGSRYSPLIYVHTVQYEYKITLVLLH
jgi:hypothetical protein